MSTTAERLIRGQDDGSETAIGRTQSRCPSACSGSRNIGHKLRS